MRDLLKVSVAATALSLFAVASARAEVKFVGATAYAEALAQTGFGQPNPGIGQGHESDEAHNYQDGVDALALAQAATRQKGGLGLAQASTSEEAQGVFDSPSSGSLILSGSSSTSGNAYATGLAAEVDYTFSVDSASALNFNYNFAADGFEADEDYIAYYLSGQDYFGGRFVYQGYAGAGLFNFDPGTYTLVLVTQDTSGDEAGTSDGESETAYNHDVFNFSISAVPSTSAAPEPGTWALMMAGIGLAGLALRRRREGVLLTA